jgi:AraC-like DNA-binding protein
MKLVREHVERDAGESFSCFDWSGKAFVCPYHVHPEIEINYIVSSSGRRLVGDHLDQFNPGDLVLLGSGLPHMYSHRAPAHAPANWAHSLYIQFLPDCLGSGFFDLRGMAPLRDLLSRAGRGLLFPRDTANRALPVLDGVLKSNGLLRVSLLLQLLDILAKCSGAKPMASSQFTAPRLLRTSNRLDLATAYINRHLFKELSQTALARHMRMSPQGFSRFFHASMGRTFATYVTELRIGAASQALLESNLTIAEVCFANGFNNLSNFNRQFRAVKGMSPREFRRYGNSDNVSRLGSNTE